MRIDSDSEAHNMEHSTVGVCVLNLLAKQDNTRTHEKGQQTHRRILTCMHQEYQG